MNPAKWLTSEEDAAWRGFLRSQAQLTAVLGHELQEESGLSAQDYAVLVTLNDQPDGRMRAFELGRELAWEKSRLSHHVTRMAERDLVTRMRCPSDQRGSFIAITPAGRKALKTAAPGHVAAVRRYFIDLLSDTELETLTAIAQKTLSALEAACDSVEAAD
jgi:DNA-binding MarR family transcriptional regulator